MIRLYIILRYYYFRWFDNSFEGLRRFLDSVPYINHGGCGLSAYIMFKYCKGKGSIYGNKDRNVIMNIKNGNNTSASHMYFKPNGSIYYYDSEWRYTKRYIKFYKDGVIKIPIDIIKESIKIPYLWNPCFTYRNLLIGLFKL